MQTRAFRRELDGHAVDLYQLGNGAGMEAWITNYGGIVVALKTPDRDGRLADVVLGCDSLDGYLAGHPFFGAICGRCANRIGGAGFSIDGESHHVTPNIPPNQLHGGERGWDKVVWQADHQGDRLVLTHTSPAGDEGYPGTVTATVTYRLTEEGLRIAFKATTDAATVVNLTHHGYFNLAGHTAGADAGSVLAHELSSPAKSFVPTDADSIPLGEERTVAGTPFDFQQAKALARDIDADDEQLRLAGGFDHHFVVGQRVDQPRFAARLAHPSSGRVCELWSTEPGFQLYTGNHLDGSVPGKDGVVYQHRGGVCLEPQVHPDAVNHAAFPSTVLRPGATYRHVSEYRFYAE